MPLLLIALTGVAFGVTGCGNAPGASLAASQSRSASASSTTSASPAPDPAVVWPAPPDPMARAVEAGLKPGPREYMTNHVHAHLDVFVDGKPVTVPAGIGIKIDDPAVRRFNEPDGSVGYGGIQLCNQPCISPLHTHDVTGIIHTESASPKPNTLRELFVEWGVALSDSCVGEFCSPTTIAIYINGVLRAGDPRTIELTDLEEIAIVIGKPPAQIPKTADFSKA